MSTSENLLSSVIALHLHLAPDLQHELFSTDLCSALRTFLKIFGFNQNLFRKTEMWYRYNIRSWVDALRQWLSSAQQPSSNATVPPEDWVQFNRTIFPWFGRQGRGNVLSVFIPWWMYGNRLYFSGMCGIFSMGACNVIWSRQRSACMQEHTRRDTRTSARRAACPPSAPCCKPWWLAEFPPAACWITARSAYTDTPLVRAEHCLLCSDQALTRTLLWQLTKGGRRKSLIKSDVLRWEVSGMQKKKS